MIYATESRANEVAAMLNERRGFGRSRAVLASQGWTVITSYAFGLSGGFDKLAADREVGETEARTEV